MNGDKLGYLCLVCFPGLWGQLKENMHVHHAIPMPPVLVGIDLGNTRVPRNLEGLCAAKRVPGSGIAAGPRNFTALNHSSVATWNSNLFGCNLLHQ